MKHYIILDNDKIQLNPSPDREVLTSTEFISRANSTEKRMRHTRVINLCAPYEYLAKGYYVSLMAEARGQRCIPTAEIALELNWKRLYQTNMADLNERLEKSFKEPAGGFSSHTFHIYFGRTEVAALEDVSKRIFDTFRCPILEVEIKYKNKWKIISVEPLTVGSLNTEQLTAFNAALDVFTGSAWVDKKSKKRAPKWIAILHDPHEKMSPSNPAALKKFVQAANQLGAEAELITRADLPRLMEYDALFIRENTAIAHHTYRFAKKAEGEGIPVIDDPASIMRCCNKVYMFELLNAHKVATPKTTVLDRKGCKVFAEKTDYPVVLKLPEGSFSRGVFKATDPADFMTKANKLLAESDIILAQEFMPSDYDWRVGVLNGKVIFVCQYFMAKGHWQIVNNEKKGKAAEGDARAVRIEDTPKDALETALKAANLIGNGLYGVDLKQNDRGVFVIEINDNPNVDTGYKGAEDEIYGLDLYKTIMAELLRRTELELKS